MEDIKCIFCDKASEHIIIRENGYNGRKCPNCGLIYISPRPSLSEIKDLYGHNQANITAESHIRNEFAKRLYAKHNLRIIRKFIRSGSLLEIGAGAGYFLDEARLSGFDVSGIELNSIQAGFMRSKMHIACEDKPLDAQSFNSKKFDIVYHCDVISHFFDPIDEFRKMNEKLREGGLVIFETGNGGDLDGENLKLIKTYQYPDHLFFFSERNIKTLLERTGFELLMIYRYSIVPQLLLINLVTKLVNTEAETPVKSKNSSNTQAVNQKSTGHGFMQLARNFFSYFAYTLRYKVGKLVQKEGRPQTIIVIAKKTKRP